MNMESSKLDDITRKIRHLLNKTVERGCTQEESETATFLVQKLLVQYNLSMTDVQEEVDDRLIDNSTIDTDRSQWVGTVWNAISSLYMCRYLCATRKRQREVTRIIIGKSYNVEIVKAFTPVIIAKISQMAKDSYQENKREYVNAYSYKTSFCAAAAETLHLRVDDYLAELSKVDVTESSGTDIVLVKTLYDHERDLNNHLIDNQFGDKVSEKSIPDRRQTPGYFEGVVAGKSIDFKQRSLTT